MSLILILLGLFSYALKIFKTLRAQKASSIIERWDHVIVFVMTVDLLCLKANIEILKKTINLIFVASVFVRTLVNYIWSRVSEDLHLQDPL